LSAAAIFRRFKSFVRESLVVKNILLFVTPVSIAILIFMLFNLSQTVEHLSQSIIQNTTTETVKQLEHFFDPATGSLKVAQEWGESAMLEDLAPEALNRQFIPVLSNYPQISSMLIANTRGEEYMLLREDSTWLNRIVSYGNTGQRIMRYRWQSDGSGTARCNDSFPDTRVYDPRERPWFKGGLNASGREMAWTQPYIFFTTKDPGITVSMKWQSKTEPGLNYVIAFDIMLIDISDYTSKLEISRNGKAFILSEEGLLIGLPKDKRFTGIDSLKKYVLLPYDSLGVAEISKAVEKWKQEGKASSPLRFGFQNDDWWAGFHSFKLGVDNSFYIGVIVPEDDFMSEVNRTRTVIVAGFLLVMVLTLLVIRGYNQKRKAYALLEIQNKQIMRQKEEIEANRDEISQQRDKIEQQRNEITDSIKYSQRIQSAVMPPEKLIGYLLPSHFVFFRPKDIVSGDFYWVQSSGSKAFWAAVDCTGHGVPGALMSIIGYNGLNRAVKEYRLEHPGDILDKLNHLVAETFRQDNIASLETGQDESSIRDGMDIALCAVDFAAKTLEYAGANNPLYLVRNNNIPLEVNGETLAPDIEDDYNSLFEVKANRQPIGSYAGSENFKNNLIRILPGDALYTFSDGFADQFGGPKGKKFMARQLKALFLEAHSMPMAQRCGFMEAHFLEWKENYEQIDDVLVFSVEVPH
jgi:serine phosphatase RsbU (regulator of sigma subunit)